MGINEAGIPAAFRLSAAFDRVMSYLIPPVVTAFDASVLQLLRLLCAALLFLFPFSLLFVGLDLLPSSWEWTTGVVITLYWITVIIIERRYASARMLAGGLFLLMLLALAVEAIGWRTGFPFGPYAYTQVLGFGFIGVPLAILFSWSSTILLSRHVARYILERWSAVPDRLTVSLGAAILTLMIDLVLEPVAAFIHGYWRWSGDAVPPQNYLSWFILGFGMTLLIEYVMPRRIRIAGDRLPLLLFGMQFTLFAFTGIVHGFLVSIVTASFAMIVIVIIMRTGRMPPGKDETTGGMR